MHGDSRREDTVRPTNFVCDQDGIANGGNGKEGFDQSPQNQALNMMY